MNVIYLSGSFMHVVTYDQWQTISIMHELLYHVLVALVMYRLRDKDIINQNNYIGLRSCNLATKKN